MASTSNNSIFLDVDSTIVENNLRITDNQDEELNKLFGSQGATHGSYPSKVIKPSPGFCIKTKDMAGKKVFVNICHTNDVPPPKDITERELKELLNSDESGEYRVPMSIGAIRTEKDKKGEDARVCDVAINTTFFNKVEKQELFKSFFFAVVFDGLKDKYDLDCNDVKILLQNKKAYGTLQLHRVQNREMADKMGISEPALNAGQKDGLKKPIIETIESVDYSLRTPEYRLFKRKNQSNCLIGEFKFPDIISADEMNLDIGEDRIILESKTRNYLLDIFVPYILRQDSCASTFDRATKILTITMPLVGG